MHRPLAQIEADLVAATLRARRLNPDEHGADLAGFYGMAHDQINRLLAERENALLGRALLSPADLISRMEVQ